MAASLTTSTSLGSVITIGTGYTGTEAILIAHFSSADNKRRSIEMYRVPVTSGSINTSVPTPFTSGTYMIKSLNTSYATQVSVNQTV